MLSIRKGLAFALAASMLVVAGCGGTKAEEKKTDTPAAPKEAVKIEFWHGMADDSAHGKMTKQLVDEFNASHKDTVQVTASYQGSYADLEKKVTSALQAGNAPAVVQNTDSMLSSLVQGKAVIALDGMIKDQSDIPAGLLAAQTIDGKLYAVPYNKSAIVLIYNKNLVKNPPKTWDEFKKVAKEVTVKDKVYGTAFTADVYYFGTHFGQTGGQWITKDGKAGFNGPEGQQALQLIVDMAKEGSAIQLKPKEYQSDYFNQGRAAMIATTSASFAYMKPVNGDPWGVAPLYAGPKGEAVPLSGANLSITAGLKKDQQEAAVTFINWMIAKEQTLKWAMGKTGYGPVRKSAIESAEWKAFVKDNPEYGVLGDALTKGVVQPSNTQWSNVQKEITTAVESALLGKASVKDALDQAAAKANDLLSKK
jgi:multiple sugar transport system substrate-binding protein